MEKEKKSVLTDSSLSNSKTEKKQSASTKNTPTNSTASKSTSVSKNTNSAKKQTSVTDNSKKSKNTIEATKVDSKNIDTNNKDKKKEKDPTLRTRLKSNSIDLVELEQLNEQNLKNFSTRARRNRVIIIILTLLLLIVVATIGTLLGISKLANNSFLYTHGNGSAVYLVDGNELERFRTPTDVQGNRLLKMDLDLKIESEGSYNIKFTILIYQDKELLENTLVYEPNRTLFAYGNDGYYYSKEAISGGQTINLCMGVLFDYRYENTLNINNFKMEIHTYLEKV